MTMLEQVLPVLEQLSREDKLLAFERLGSLLKEEEARIEPDLPLKSLYGLWADLKVDVSEDDIAEVRREMWANFPREDI